MFGRYRSARGASLLERVFGRYPSARGASLLERVFGRYPSARGASLLERVFGRYRSARAASRLERGERMRHSVAMTLIARERRGPLEIWTLNRAERLNALPDPQDGEAFAQACEAVNADRTVSCVILTGAGRAFSAGGDLTAMRDRRDLFGGTGIDIRENYRRVVHRIVRSLYGLEVPLIAAVNGPAMGLGCDIAGLADIRIASEAASFGVPFLKLGILPGDGGTWLMPRNVGYARSAELLFTGRTLDAATALDWGLVNRVVPADSLMDEALATAAQVTAQAPQALRMTKALLRQGRDATFDQILEMTAAMQALAHLTEDHAEGVSAVLEKRTAQFEGR